MKLFGVDRTPTLVVNGKYRLMVASAGGDEQTLELVSLAGRQGEQIVAGRLELGPTRLVRGAQS